MAVLAPVYDPVNARVILSATALSPYATVALFEVSVDQKHWVTVRGGAAVPVVSAAATLYDYEFAAGVVNYYRVSAVNTNPPSFVAVGTAATAVGVSVTPGLPTGWAEGDLLVLWAGIRNSGTGTVVCPAGYTVMMQVDNIGVFGRRAGPAGTETAPTIAVTGGVTGSSGTDVIAQIACFRNLERTPAGVAYQLNPSKQNINYPPLAGFQSNWATALYLGWKQTSWTVPGVTTLTGAVEIAETVSTAGADAGIVWDYSLMIALGVVAPAPVASGAFVVATGTAAISYGVTLALRTADFVTRTSATVTPNLTQVWLKCPTAPWLNLVVLLTDWDTLTRTSRVTPYSVVSQRDALAVTDYASPTTVNISLWAETLAEIAALDTVLSVGNVMLLHTPANVQLESMYAGIGTYNYTRPSHNSQKAAFSVALTQLAAPDPSIVGYQSTWATLITNYSTWQDVLNANATWQSVLNLVGTPADALVGH